MYDPNTPKYRAAVQRARTLTNDQVKYEVYAGEQTVRAKQAQIERLQEEIRDEERILDALRRVLYERRAGEPKCCCWAFDHPPCAIHPRPGEIYDKG
jgi:hypothetical protein